MNADRKDLLAGFFLVALGLLFLAYAAGTLPMGSAFRMGPGYFPIMLSVLLAALGLMTLVRSLGRASSAFGAVSWRGIVLITAASLSYALIMPRYGLVPALLIAVLLSAFSSRRMTLGLALILACGLSLFCTVIFRYGLGLPVQLFGAG